ncbi:hypothetical protein RCL1_006497 [Eukaryota sp. TZLM3-RCL]
MSIDTSLHDLCQELLNSLRNTETLFRTTSDFVSKTCNQPELASSLSSAVSQSITYREEISATISKILLSFSEPSSPNPEHNEDTVSPLRSDLLSTPSNLSSSDIEHSVLLKLKQLVLSKIDEANGSLSDTINLQSDLAKISKELEKRNGLSFVNNTDDSTDLDFSIDSNCTFESIIVPETPIPPLKTTPGLVSRGSPVNPKLFSSLIDSL